MSLFRAAGCDIAGYEAGLWSGTPPMARWDAARWRAVSAEIDQILDLRREARQAALDALRARDAALAADVAHLLAEQPAVEAGRLPRRRRRLALLPTSSSTSEDGVVVPRLAVSLPPGAAFGGYRIHRLLGRGGMGIVYEAEEIESGRRVALKVLQRRFDDDARSRAVRSARAGSRRRSITSTACSSSAPRRSTARRRSRWS